MAARAGGEQCVAPFLHGTLQISPALACTSPAPQTGNGWTAQPVYWAWQRCFKKRNLRICRWTPNEIREGRTWLSLGRMRRVPPSPQRGHSHHPDPRGYSKLPQSVSRRGGERRGVSSLRAGIILRFVSCFYFVHPFTNAGWRRRTSRVGMCSCCGVLLTTCLTGGYECDKA